MSHEPIDDLDVLYARLEPVEPPPHFVADVMARVRQSEALSSPRRRAIWLVVHAVALLALIWAAFTLGRVLALGAFDHGAVALLFDADLVLAAPTVWLMAVGESVPLFSIVCLVASAMMVAVSTHALLLGVARSRGARGA